MSSKFATHLKASLARNTCSSILLSCELVLAGSFQGADAGSYLEAQEHLPQAAGAARIADRGNDSRASARSPSKQARFRLDGSKSLISARVFVGGLLAAFGHAHTVSVSGLQGEVQMTADSVVPAAVQMEFDAKTAHEVSREFSDRDRQKINHSISTEALQTSKYPGISFKSIKVSIARTDETHFHAKISGDLILHGMTRSIEVPADVTLTEGGLTAHDGFRILHSDFGIRQLSAVAGGIKAKDGIEISYELVATRE